MTADHLWSSLCAWIQREYPGTTVREDGVLVLPDGGMLGRREAMALRGTQAGIICAACGAVWPGYATGFWRRNNGRWEHWCSGGAPGRWTPAAEVRVEVMEDV